MKDLHDWSVTDVGEDRLRRVEQGPSVNDSWTLVERALVAIEHHQLGRHEPVELAAQLAADAAACTRDEHPLAGEVVGDLVEVRLDLVAAEQVGLAQVADVADTDGLLEQLVHGGQHLHVEPPPRGRGRRCP